MGVAYRGDICADRDASRDFCCQDIDIRLRIMYNYGGKQKIY